MRVFVSIPRDGDVFKTFLPPEVCKYMESVFEVKYLDGCENLGAEEFCAAVRDFDAVITGWGHTQISYDMLRDSRVRIIAHTGGSVGNLIGEGVYENGIRVMSGNILYAESVAEGTIAYMLTGLRRIPYYINEVRSGGWHGSGFFTEGLLDQTVGIIGLGTISKILIKMLQSYRVQLKIYSSHKIDAEFLKENNAEQASLDEIFSSCKIVSLHSAMTEKTRGMIGKEHFDLLRRGALFVNTARGDIVREDEMIAALKEKRFSAVLDVFSREPLDEKSELRTLENVYCIPHMGGPTLDRRPYITKRLAENILKLENGGEAELEIKGDAAKRMTKQ